MTTTKKKNWIPKKLKKNRVKNYVKKKYGKKAFTKSGKLKLSALNKAEKAAKSKSLKDAISLAKTFKKKGRK